MTNRIIIQPSEGTHKKFVAKFQLWGNEVLGKIGPSAAPPSIYANIWRRMDELQSFHLQESDSRPLSLCPVCLRKLQSSIRFDVAARYHRLQQFYSKAGFNLKQIGNNDDDKIR